mmetsp:Transcript_37454/g.116478  ORF Transcript_37454/g.116478 Transcript_37454/m.116478 type:complete len:222 (-) Transcript_37454:207-872(-)
MLASTSSFVAAWMASSRAPCSSSLGNGERTQPSRLRLTFALPGSVTQSGCISPPEAPGRRPRTRAAAARTRSEAVASAGGGGGGAGRAFFSLAWPSPPEPAVAAAPAGAAAGAGTCLGASGTAAGVEMSGTASAREGYGSSASRVSARGGHSQASGKHSKLISSSRFFALCLTFVISILLRRPVDLRIGWMLALRFQRSRLTSRNSVTAAGTLKASYMVSP